MTSGRPPIPLNKGRRSTRAVARIAGLALAAALSAGCSIVPANAPATLYRLPPSPPAAPDTQTQRLDTTLRVDTPYAGQSIDSTRILVFPVPTQLSAYRDARWSDTPPLMWREKLGNALRAAGVFQAVSTDSYNHRAELALGGELQAFQVEYDQGRPMVRIRFDAFLAATSSHAILATHTFSHTELLPSADLPAVVDGFGRAADAISRDVVQWVSQRAAEHHRATVAGTGRPRQGAAR
ncbi:MAG: ABC-type transport auxiliary lipoprotein family protein [Burkholderiaceae bacterium]|jgi:cholesterol transport system auxiliary component